MVAQKLAMSESITDSRHVHEDSNCCYSCDPYASANGLLVLDLFQRASLCLAERYNCQLPLVKKEPASGLTQITGTVHRE